MISKEYKFQSNIIKLEIGIIEIDNKFNKEK